MAEHADIRGQDDRPELADLIRMARRLMRRAVAAARVEDEPVPRLLREHLGPDAATLPVVSGSWRGYDHVNVQAGLDAWLAGRGRSRELVGLTGFRHASFGLADLTRPGPDPAGLGVGSVAMAALPAGPGGRTRACVKCGLYLVKDRGARLAVLLRGPDDADPDSDAALEVAGADQAAALRVVEEVRQLAVERNVFRGQVISFGDRMFGHGRGGGGGPLRFLDRPRLDRGDVVLPPAVLDGIERQVLGVARHAGPLLASGQHLKRGVLLHGAPGTGKTHTVRYLLGRRPDVTAVVLSGYALRWIAEACSVARVLQPSVVVIEDVEGIAEERWPRAGQHPLLFQLLNEMDGLDQDADVTFVLTTSRPDLLEAALAARPGRVDHAAELPVPDAEARRQLIALYQGRLVLDLSDPDMVIKRTDGVTAAFLKELLRRAALLAAEDAPAADGHPGQASADGDPSAATADGHPGQASADGDPSAATADGHPNGATADGHPNGATADGHPNGAGADGHPNGAGADGGRPGPPLRLTDAHLAAALDQLLDVRSRLTRTLLGGRGQDAVIRPMGADAVIRGSRA